MIFLSICVGICNRKKRVCRFSVFVLGRLQFWLVTKKIKFLGFLNE
jgi:hypothetical protein